MCLANGAIPINFLPKSILFVIAYLDKFDFLGNRATEFTYMYGEIPMSSWKYNSFNLDSKSFEEKVVSLNEFSYKQSNSVLKHLEII